MLDDVLNGSLRQAAAMVASGDIAEHELVAAAITRIESSAALRACFLRADFESAKASLEQRPTSALVNGIGLLRGIPLAHKDLFSYPGRISSFAAHPSFHRKGIQQAEALHALDKAGAINLGALHMSEFAMGAAGWSEHYGFIDNPISPLHVSGGSSSGSAAAVAHKGVFGSLGTDTGGSIRIPAAFCGVVGFKPTNGLISVHGAHPVSASLDTVGPLTRNVADNARMLDALVNGESSDGQAGPYEAALARFPRTMRVGWVRPISFPVPMDPAISAEYEHCVARMKDSGFLVSEVRVDDWALLNALTGIVFMSEAATVHLRRLGRDALKIGGQVRERLQQGLTFPASLYLSALEQRAMRRARLQADVFSQVDVLLCPVTPCLPPERSVYDGFTDASEAVAFNARVGAYTGMFNYLGLPVISMPVGKTENGLTIGMQLAGNIFCESTVLQAACMLEQACSL